MPIFRRRVVTWIAGAASGALLLLALGCGTPRTSRAPSTDVHALLEAIADDHHDHRREPIDRRITLAVELGRAALPQLVPRLQTARSEAEREGLGLAISYIGGNEAVDALRAAAQRSSDIQLMIRWAFAAPTLPTTVTYDSLQSYLDKPHLGNEWPLAVQAAYSLGISRANGAVAALNAAARPDATFIAGAARDAVRWMAGPDETVLFVVSQPDDELLQAMVAGGLPHIDRESVWCERSAGRHWTHVESVWKVEAGCPMEPSPSVHFTAFRSSDDQRAVVAAAFHIGPLDGAGYNFLLQRQTTGWALVGLEFTWVS